MIKQTPILVKVDSEKFQKLNDLSKSLGCNRNKLINFFIAQGIENLSCHVKCKIVSAYQFALSDLL